MKTPVKILYLEDDELDQRVLLRMIREKTLPYDVTTAPTLAEARAHLAETRFDLIIADYHLPDGHASELFDEVRDIPFILLTGTLQENLAIRTLARGADDYLIKDVDRRYLEAIPTTVEKTLYRQHLHERAQQLTRELHTVNEQLENQSQKLAAQADELAAVNEQLLTEREELRRRSKELEEQSQELRQMKDQAERTARAMESLARLVEENPDPVLRVSLDGTVQYKNPASYQLADQWNGLDPWRVPPAVAEVISEAYVKTKVISREMAFGERTYVVTAAPAPVRARYVSVFVRDITERKRAEEMLAADLAATKRLQQIGARFVRQGELKEVLGEVVDAALAITGTDKGNIQLLDAASGGLQIVASRGFDRPFLEFWNTVTGGQGVCGTVLKKGERVIVEDVTQSPIFAGTPALKVQLDAGVHAVQSTPLLGHLGALLGVLSTHWHAPHRPGPHELHLLDLLALETVDIIERAHAQEALRESEERFRGLVTASSAALYRMSPDWSEMCQLQSRSFLTNTDQPSRTWLQEYIPPDEQSRVMAAIQEAIRTKSMFELEHRVRRADGSLGWTYSRAVPLLDANGEIVEWFGAANDITEHKRAEEALRQSQETLEAFFAASPGILNITDEEFRYIKTDSLTPTYFGLDRQSIVGKSIKDLAPEFIAEFGQMMREVIETGQPKLNREVKSPVPSRPNEVTYWRASYFPVPLAGGKQGIGIIGVEITDIKKAEETQRELTAILENRVAQRTAELR